MSYQELPDEPTITVGQLREWLADLPDDMPVVTPDPGCGCCASDALWSVEMPVLLQLPTGQAVML